MAKIATLAISPLSNIVAPGSLKPFGIGARRENIANAILRTRERRFIRIAPGGDFEIVVDVVTQLKVDALSERTCRTKCNVRYGCD
jgi:hypothetical protein